MKKSVKGSAGFLNYVMILLIAVVVAVVTVLLSRKQSVV